MKIGITFMLLGLVLVLTSTLNVAATSIEERTLGEENALVTIELFTDFQAVFSGRWYKQTFPIIKKNYIDEGKVKLVVKYFPLGVFPDSYEASVAAECAAEQGRFFDYISLIYNNQKALSEKYLIEYAKEINLDLAKFIACTKEDYTEQIVNSDIKEARSKGLSASPVFFINGKVLYGAQPYYEFETAIESALSSKIKDGEDFETRKLIELELQEDVEFMKVGKQPKKAELEERIVQLENEIDELENRVGLLEKIITKLKAFFSL